MKLEYKALKEKVKEFNKKDAKFYGNMFAKLNKIESADLNVSFDCVFCILTILHSFFPDEMVFFFNV